MRRASPWTSRSPASRRRPARGAARRARATRPRDGPPTPQPVIISGARLVARRRARAASTNGREEVERCCASRCRCRTCPRCRRCEPSICGTCSLNTKGTGAAVPAYFQVAGIGERELAALVVDADDEAAEHLVADQAVDGPALDRLELLQREHEERLVLQPGRPDVHPRDLARRRRPRFPRPRRAPSIAPDDATPSACATRGATRFMPPVSKPSRKGPWPFSFTCRYTWPFSSSNGHESPSGRRPRSRSRALAAAAARKRPPRPAD